MAISDCAQASWRNTAIRGCGFIFAALVLLWSAAAAAQTFTLTLQPNTIPAGTENTPYSQMITAVGGNAPYIFAVTSGSLPVGLTLDPGGLLSGTPTTPSGGGFTITATDNDGNTGFRPYTFSIGTQGGLAINPGALPDGTRGVAYSQSVTASGGSGGYVYSISAGSLPPGLSLNPSSGAITGTPTTGGSFGFTVFARDSNGNTGTQGYTLNIIVPIVVNPPTLPNGTTGTAYSQTVTATGGTAPYTFVVTAGALPTGLSLAAGGALTGTPTAAGTYNFTIQATDAGASTGNRAYSVTIAAAPLTINPTSLPAGTQGVAYNQTIVASGGSAPYSYVVLSGSLPPGLSLDGSTGALTGTPTAGGSYNFTVQATDTAPNTGTRNYTLNVGTSSLTVNPAGLPNASQGIAYNQALSASGGTGPYTFALTSGALPAGLSLSGAGVISGTPTGSGLSNFTVQATDSLGNVGSRGYAVNVGTSSLTVNPASLPAGTRGVAYSRTVSATGGTGPYTFALASGALPPGLSLNAASGLISGTPSAVGSSSFSIRATDTLGNVGLRAYAVSVGLVSLIVNPATLPAPVAGKPYRQTMAASGGTGPYTFSVTSGALPPGLTLNAASGVISGATTALGGWSFTIQALDGSGNIGSRAYTLTGRPDPASDPEVIGLVNAQVAVTRRFASAQIDNVTRHLESLHDRFSPCSFDFGLSLPPSADYRGRYPGDSPYSSSPGIAARSYESPAGQVARRTPGAQDCAENGWASSLSGWVSGAVQFGSGTPDGATVKNRFNTSGLTAGLDWRAADNLIVGAALGFGSDLTTVGLNATRSDASSMNATFYASYKPFDAWFIDAAIGFGNISHDTRRFVTNDGSTVEGTRAGTYWYGAISTGYEVKYDAVRLKPYVRADFMSATLDGYTEQGSSAERLTYGAMGFNSLAGTLGLRGSYDIPVVWGVLTPTARVEYRQALEGAFQQTMYYTDLGPSVSSVLSQGSATRGMVNASLGIRALGLGGMTAELEYGTSSAGAASRSQSIRGALRLPF